MYRATLSREFYFAADSPPLPGGARGGRRIAAVPPPPATLSAAALDKSLPTDPVRRVFANRPNAVVFPDVFGGRCTDGRPPLEMDVINIKFKYESGNAPAAAAASVASSSFLSLFLQ